MDFRLFFKNKFLKTTFGEFANSINGADYSQFKDTLKKNRSWYIPASIFSSKDKIIKDLFNNIDGTIIKKGENEELIKSYSAEDKNNRLEQKELYDWVKYNYKKYKGENITDEELANMKMSEFMNNVEEFLNKGFTL